MPYAAARCSERRSGGALASRRRVCIRCVYRSESAPRRLAVIYAATQGYYDCGEG
jgi:hypothetical protein